MNTRSIQFRLVAWYAGWLSLLFIIFGVFVYLNLGYELEKALREALQRRARQVADTVQRSQLDWKPLGLEIRNHFASEANNRFTRVSIDGVVKYVSGPPADNSFDPSTVPHGKHLNSEEWHEHRTLSDGAVMVFSMVPRQLGTNRLLVEEGGLLTPITTTTHTWLIALVCGLAALVSIAIAGGYVLVKRALNPVGHIIRGAERITSGNLAERLPVLHTRDEIERLSLTLNHMIARLEEGVQQRQRFLDDASHELRTPLTIIQAELEMATKRVSATADASTHAASALEEVQRLKKIVSALLTLSRLDAGEGQEHPTLFDLGALVSLTASQMELLAKDKNISVTCRTRESIRIQGDQPGLKQIIVNLLDNAIKYTPDGGRVDVEVSAADGKAILEVRDNGIGIPRDALPQVFDRFYRVDKARSREAGGTGLGLSIVRSICAAHHGHARVESTEGQGSRFIVELPLPS